MNGWGHLLALGPVAGKFEEQLTDSQEIVDEDKVDSVAENWNVDCIREALKTGAAEIRGTSTPDITMKKKYLKFSRVKRKPLEPDMAIFLRDSKNTALAIGDNKCSTKWQYSQLFYKPPATVFLPFRQVVTYCRAGRTRYGWIMTDAELVVIRVFLAHGSTDHYKVEHAMVPWINSGEGILTVNLAIWWLAMMSLKPNYRAIEQSSRMMPINLWWEGKDHRGVIYDHHLSGRQTSTLPPGDASVRRPVAAAPAR